VLFPYRLARAVIFFLHFFSLFVSGQPLMTAGGPKRSAPDTRYLAIWGRMIDTRRAMERAGRDQPADLVPKDWELVRRDAEGAEQALASNVLSYDLAANGDIVYTNGTAVYLLDGEGNRSRICLGEMVERVIALW
jgi:hypothetical protein